MPNLIDYVELITKGTTPTSVGGSFANKGINYVKVESISETGVFIKHKFNFIEENTHYKLLKRSQIKENDILFSIAGTIGRTAIVTSDILPCNTNQALAIIRPDLSKLDPHFLLYCLKDKNRLNKAKSNVVQSVQSNLSLTEIKKIQIPDYPLERQQKISNLLKTFDNKIQLNQKMQETLEDTATALFKSWFIDFEPVRAKAEGRPTGLSKEISDLFPDSFEDSELGEIPKGWKSGNLGDLFEPSRGKIITKAKTNPGNVPVVAGGIKPPYYHSESNVKGPVITISASGTAGYVNLYYQDVWASDCSYVNNDTFKQIFFAHSFFKINQERIYDLRHGAVQQHVYPKDLVELPIVIPPDSLINTYEDIASQLHKKIETNLIESETLNELRDTLLPKLISGELKMPDAENFLKEADI